MNQGFLTMLVVATFAGAVRLFDDVLDVVTRAFLQTSGLVSAGPCRPLRTSILHPAVYQKLFCADYLIQG